MVARKPGTQGTHLPRQAIPTPGQSSLAGGQGFPALIPLSLFQSQPVVPLRRNVVLGATTGDPSVKGTIFSPQNLVPSVPHLVLPCRDSHQQHLRGHQKSEGVHARFVGLKGLLIYHNPLKPSKPGSPLKQDRENSTEKPAGKPPQDRRQEQPKAGNPTPLNAPASPLTAPNSYS